MKKKKLFLLASLAAALAMTSCSSFDEPAALDGDGMPLTRSGSRTAPVSTEADLRDALEFGESDITITGDITLTQALEINNPVSISGTAGKKITSSAPIICKANVTFKDLVIDATTPRGSGAINIAAEGIDVILNNTQVKQNTAGTSDNMSNEGIGILYQAYTNVNLRLENNSVLTLPNNYVRGICLSPTSATVIKKLEIVDSKIIMGTDLSNPAVYARGLSFSYIKTTDNLPILIKNSVIEGGYYAINTYGNTSVLNFNVENSTLNGRCGFNVWTPNTTANIKGGTIIGQNPYMGGWENFANVMINNGANNCTINEFSNRLVLIILSLIGLAGVIFCGYYNGPVWMYRCLYGGNMLLFIFGSVCGTMMLYGISKLLFDRPNNIISLICDGSIVILAFHIYFVTAGLHYPIGYGYYLEAIMVMILFIPIILVCKKHFPILLGYRGVKVSKSIDVIA